ncbi:unnamed protein product, partial [Staurois parvus]
TDLPAGDPLDLPLSILEVGIAGRLELITKPPTSNGPAFPLSTIPNGLPPYDVDLSSEVIQKYLSDPEWLSVHDFDWSQRSWPRTKDVSSLFHMDISAPQTDISMERNSATGELRGISEVSADHIGLSAQNSLSLRRPPGPPSQSVKGSTSNFPFWPGGMDEPTLEQMKAISEEDEALDFEKDLLSAPPGWKNGMNFKQLDGLRPPGVLSLASLLGTLEDFTLADSSEDEDEAKIKQKPKADKTEGLHRTNSLEELGVETVSSAPAPPPPASPLPQSTQEQWAIPLSSLTPVDDFYKRIPDLAFRHPFELDLFQKKAIQCLEDGFFGLHRSSHVCGEDCGSRICHSTVSKAYDQSHIYFPHKGLVQSEVSRFQNHFWRRRPDHRRCPTLYRGVVSYYDYRDFTIYAVQWF